MKYFERMDPLGRLLLTKKIKSTFPAPIRSKVQLICHICLKNILRFAENCTDED